MKSRREFLKKSLFAGSALAIVPSVLSSCLTKSPFLNISLAEWSLHNKISNKELTNLEFPVYTKEQFDIHAVEYVSTFFETATTKYLSELLNITKTEGITNVLIMVDKEGDLGCLNDEKRNKAVENHYKWIDAAKILGCHSIRVNARGKGSPNEVADAAVDGLSRLTEYGEKENINVIVENHGGYSSNGEWLANVIRAVNKSHCGTLPDFGNFCIERQVVLNEDGTSERKCIEEYDKYEGVRELMPFAKGVSAKSHDFDELGNEVHTDFYKMIDIVGSSGYNGFIGIEYEGKMMSENEGIKATKNLIESVLKTI